MKYFSRWNRFLLFLLIVVLSLLVTWCPPAYAYNEYGHKKIITLSINLLRRTTDIFDKIHPNELSQIETYLKEGAVYADKAGPICKWHIPLREPEEHHCDTIHHYKKHDVIESYLGVDIGHPGNLTADVYAQKLFDLAVRFYPHGSASEISLNELTGTNGGYVVFGGDPLSWNPIFPGADPCYRLIGCGKPLSWPSWARKEGNTKIAKQSRRVSYKYLGWSLHMLADLSVPHHMRNEATESHVQWENKADVFLQTYNPQTYIYVSVPRNSQNPIKDILSSSDLAKEWQKNLERCFSTSPGDMDYCMLEPNTYNAVSATANAIYAYLKRVK